MPGYHRDDLSNYMAFRRLVTNLFAIKRWKAIFYYHDNRHVYFVH